MSDSDDNDYDSIGSANDLSVQERPSTTSVTSQLKRARLVFVSKIYLTSLLLVIVVAGQWFLITMIKSIQNFVIVYNYIVIIVIFIHFLMLAFMQYLLRYKYPKIRIAVFIYIFMLVEFGSVILSRPLAESDKWSLLYASILTLGIYGVSLLLALKSHMKKERSRAVSLSLWCLECFLTSSICSIIALNVKVVELQISIVIIMIFLIMIFFFMWGRSFASIKFFKTEHSYTCYYLILHYFNILSLFANGLVFFENIKALI